MTTTHTPGPWAYDADSQEVFSDDARHGAGWIAFIKGNDGEGRPLTEPERLANARLIAAAPDLLAAAIDALETFERRFPDSPTAHDLRAAIARATGEA